MIDFLIFLLFMAMGMLVASFLGWMLMRSLWSGSEAKRGWIGAMVAAMSAIYSASR